MTSSLLDMPPPPSSLGGALASSAGVGGAAAAHAPSAPATEALEAFLSRRYHRPILPENEAAADTSGPRPTLKRVRSAIISPSASDADLLEEGRRRSSSSSDDPLDLSALLRAAAPVEASVAFPSIEWNADGDDEDEDEDKEGNEDDDENDLAGVARGLISRSLDQQLALQDCLALAAAAAASDKDDEEDDDDDDDVACRPHPRKRRSVSSGLDAFGRDGAIRRRRDDGRRPLRRSRRSETKSLDAVPLGGGGGRTSSTASISPSPFFKSVGDLPSVASSFSLASASSFAVGGAATSLLSGLPDLDRDELTLPGPAASSAVDPAAFAAALRPLSASSLAAPTPFEQGFQGAAACPATAALAQSRRPTAQSSASWRDGRVLR